MVIELRLGVHRDCDHLGRLTQKLSLREPRTRNAPRGFTAVEVRKLGLTGWERVETGDYCQEEDNLLNEANSFGTGKVYLAGSGRSTRQLWIRLPATPPR